MPTLIRTFPSVRLATVLAAGVLSVAVLGGCSGESQSPGMNHSSSAPAASGSASGSVSSDTSRAGDVMFAQMMIPHHQQAVEMADMALDKSSASADVKKLAGEVKAAQDPEIKQMQGWLQEWGEPTAMPDGMNHDDGMMTEADMTSLKAADGQEFDKQWLTMMIAHHRGAVEMAQQVLATTQNPEVKALAESIVTSQNAEIDEMEKMI